MQVREEHLPILTKPSKLVFVRVVVLPEGYPIAGKDYWLKITQTFDQILWEKGLWVFKLCRRSQSLQKFCDL